MNPDRMVYILDDDAGVRKSLAWVLESAGFQSAVYGSASVFLNEAQVLCPSCLILDMHMTGMTGLDVLKEIRNRPDLSMPTMILTATDTITTAVACMKAGACDYLEKPVDPPLLLEKVMELLDLDTAHRANAVQRTAVNQRVDQLTDREREVLGLLCEGNSTKQMAHKLDISIKTVSIHRWHLMKKMQVNSATEAIHLALSARASNVTDFGGGQRVSNG